MAAGIWLLWWLLLAAGFVLREVVGGRGSGERGYRQMVVKIKRSASLVKHVGVGLRVFMRSDGMYLGTGIEAKINEHKRQNDFVACLNVQTHLNSVKDDLKHTKLHCVAVSTGKNDPWTRYEARHSGKTRPFMTWEQLLDRSQPQTEVMIPICNVSRREEFVLPCSNASL